jgi:hypothetical protein
MKKLTKPTKQLLLKTQTVRELQSLTDDKLRGIAGGAGCHDSFCGWTRASSE